MATTTKVWGTVGGCQVLETIDKPYQRLKRRSNGGWGSARLTFMGADLDGKVWADATLFSATAGVEQSGLGVESHKYQLLLARECKCTASTITFRCRAGGGMSGFLKDSDMNASAKLSVNVCGTIVPLELTLDPKLDESEQTTTINLGLKGSQTSSNSGSVTVPLPGGAAVGGQVGGTSQADANGSLSITSKKVRGKADSVTMPAISTEGVKEGCATVQIESTTSASLSAYNNDSTGDDCRIRVQITNTIETIDVQIECDCQQQTPGTVGPVNFGEGEEFVRQASLLREVRAGAAGRLDELLRDLGQPDAIVNGFDAAAIDQLLTLQMASENALDLDVRRGQSLAWALERRSTLQVSAQKLADAEDLMYDVEVLDQQLAMNAQGWLFTDAELASLQG